MKFDHIAMTENCFFCEMEGKKVPGPIVVGLAGHHMCKKHYQEMITENRQIGRAAGARMSSPRKSSTVKVKRMIIVR